MLGKVQIVLNHYFYLVIGSLIKCLIACLINRLFKQIIDDEINCMAIAEDFIYGIVMIWCNFLPQRLADQLVAEDRCGTKRVLCAEMVLKMSQF